MSPGGNCLRTHGTGNAGASYTVPSPIGNWILAAQYSTPAGHTLRCSRSSHGICSAVTRWSMQSGLEAERWHPAGGLRDQPG